MTIMGDMTDTPVTRTRTRAFNVTAASGEVFTATEEIEYIPRSRSKEPFVYLYMEGIDRLLNAHLTAREYRIWFELVRRSRMSEPFELSNARLAAHVGMDPANVSRAIGKLLAADLILRPGKGMFALSPEIVWRGSAAARHEAMEPEELTA